MRATEFIRGLLDLIDSADQQENQVQDYEDEVAEPEMSQGKQYSNTPDEQITPTDTILSIGNDLNKPKHPADIRVSTVALYPNTAYKG
jgi:hypothetical protein